MILFGAIVAEAPWASGGVQVRPCPEIREIGRAGEYLWEDDEILEFGGAGDELWEADAGELPFSGGPPAPPQRAWKGLELPIKQQLRSLLDRFQRQSQRRGQACQEATGLWSGLGDADCEALEWHPQGRIRDGRGPDPELTGTRGCARAPSPEGLDGGLPGPGCAAQLGSLRETLRQLDQLGDPSRILTVRGVRRLGINAGAFLYEQFAPECGLEAVLTYCVRKGAGSNPSRIGELAFVVAASQADVQRVLDRGSPQHVGGHLVEVAPFDSQHGAERGRH